MTDTLAQLRKQFPTDWPSLTAVREGYFTHLKTDRRLRELINAGRINLRLRKTYNSPRGQQLVYLKDLAEFLDELAKQPT